jgi:hypothetical protein
MAEEQKKVRKWSELDFRGVAILELPNILNMFNQRLATIEDNTYARDESGKILSDKDGNPLTLTKFYMMKAEEEMKAAAAKDAAAEQKESK